MLTYRTFRSTFFLVDGRQLSRFAVLVVLMLVISIGATAQTGDNDDREDAVAIFNQAQDAHEKGDLATAISLYKKALKIVPEFAEAEYQCGNAYLALNDRAGAEHAFRRALEIRADWTLPMTSLGSLLVDNRKFDEAAVLLSKAIELDAQNFPAYASLAELRLKTESPAPVLRELLEKLTAATSKANPTASVWTARAALEISLGKRDAAHASLANALSIDAKNRYAITQSAELAIFEGDTVRAADMIDKLEKLSAVTGATRLLRAKVLAAGGKPADALSMLADIDPLTPGLAEFRALVATAGSNNAAELEKLLDKDRSNGSVLGRLCKLYRVDNPTKALDYCRRAVEAEPKNLEHVVGYGAALVQAKAFDQAVNLLRKLIEFAPEYSTAHANLASALFELKRYAEAKVQYEWLISRQPDLVIAYYLLGITNDHLAAYLDAMANYQQFLRRADPAKNQLEIDKVNLRMPSLQKQVKDQKGKKGA